MPAFGIYGHEVQNLDEVTDIPGDVREKLLRFARAAVAVATMRGKSYLQIGSMCMGIGGSIIDQDFIQDYLGMRVESVDEVEIIRRMVANTEAKYTAPGRSVPLKPHTPLMVMGSMSIAMAQAAKKLFEENIRYSNGEPVKVIIADTTIGRGEADNPVCLREARRLMETEASGVINLTIAGKLLAALCPGPALAGGQQCPSIAPAAIALPDKDPFAGCPKPPPAPPSSRKKTWTLPLPLPPAGVMVLRLWTWIP